MLRGLALDHYYTNLKNKPLSVPFNKLCKATYPQAIYLQAIDPQVTNPQPTQAKTYGKELANLAKLYTNKSKYSGKNNNFNFKLTIFTDLY